MFSSDHSSAVHVAEELGETQDPKLETRHKFLPLTMKGISENASKPRFSFLRASCPSQLETFPVAVFAWSESRKKESAVKNRVFSECNRGTLLLKCLNDILPEKQTLIVYAQK